MLNQKGFALLIPLVVITLVVAAGVGGFFLFLNNKKPYLVKNNSEKTVEKTELSKEQKIAGKILFVARNKQISLASPDGTNIKSLSTQPEFKTEGDQELPPRLLSLSPDGQKFLFSNSLNHFINYYVASIDGTTTKLIASNKIGPSKQAVFQGWTEDSKKLLVVTKTSQDDYEYQTQKNRVIEKSIIGLYDLETEEEQSLYLLGEGIVKVQFYNQQQNLLVYELTKEQDLGKSYTKQLFKLNTETQELEEFPDPTIISESTKMLNNPYFFTSSADFSAKERKEVTLASYQNPTAKIATFSLDNSQRDFLNYYLLSPDQKFIAIPTSEGPGDKNQEINIYSTTGQKVSTLDAHAFNASNIAGSHFSPDGTKIMIVGTTYTKGDENSYHSWQVFDVSTGKALNEISKDPDNLTLDPAFWLK